MPELMNKKEIIVFQSFKEQKDAEDESIRHLLPAERLRLTTVLIKLMYKKQLEENIISKRINFIQS